MNRMGFAVVVLAVAVVVGCGKKKEEAAVTSTSAASASAKSASASPAVDGPFEGEITMNVRESRDAQRFCRAQPRRRRFDALGLSSVRAPSKSLAPRYARAEGIGVECLENAWAMSASSSASAGTSATTGILAVPHSSRAHAGERLLLDERRAGFFASVGVQVSEPSLPVT
jgi:hypothetical protein